MDLFFKQVHKSCLAPAFSAAFMGRISYTMTLDELPLSDCQDFWNGNGSQFSSYDKFKILSITGGIPRYLEEIQPQYSAEDNIRHLCFKRGGLLTNEFKDFFRIYEECLFVPY